MEIVNLLY